MLMQLLQCRVETCQLHLPTWKELSINLAYLIRKLIVYRHDSLIMSIILDITNKQMEISTQLNSMIYIGLSWNTKLTVYRHDLLIMSIMLWTLKKLIDWNIYPIELGNIKFCIVVDQMQTHTFNARIKPRWLQNRDKNGKSKLFTRNVWKVWMRIRKQFCIIFSTIQSTILKRVPRGTNSNQHWFLFD